MKYKIATAIILAAYCAFSIATSVEKETPVSKCYSKMEVQDYLHITGGSKYLYNNFRNDTMMLTYTDTTGLNIQAITDSLCRYAVQKCQLSQVTIAIRDNTNDPALFNSPYGRLLLVKRCP